MVARCKEYAECAEGGMWCIRKRGDTSRSDADIFAAMDTAYKCISAEDPGVISNDVSGRNVTIDGEQRGAKRQMPWLQSESNDAHVARACIDEEKGVGGLILLTLDMRETKESKIPATSRVDTEALNCQEMIHKIMEQEVKASIIAYYDEYLDEPKTQPTAFASPTHVFVPPNDASRAEGTDLLRQVRKSPKNNIYVYGGG